MLYQILSQNMETLKQQLQLIEQQKMEVNVTLDALDDVSKAEKGNDVMLPLGSGVFAEGSISDNDSFNVNIGAGIIVKKNKVELGKFLESRKKEIDNASKQIQMDLEKSSQKIEEIAAELQQAQMKK